MTPLATEQFRLVCGVLDTDVEPIKAGLRALLLQQLTIDDRLKVQAIMDRLEWSQHSTVSRYLDALACANCLPLAA